MKQFIFLFLCFTLRLPALYSQTTLNPGDLAFINYKSSNGDGFAFVNLVTLEPCTKILFTDNPYRIATGFCAFQEYVIEMTVTTRIPCGSTITYQDNGSSLGTITTSAGAMTVAQINGTNYGLSNGGDNGFLFQGTYASPSFVAGFKSSPWDAAGTANCSDREDSELPTTLTNGVNAVALTGCVYGRYNCSVISGTAAALASAINNASNWINCNTNFTMPTTCSFTVTPCPNCTAGPASGATTFSATSITSTTATINWAKCAPGMNVLVVVKEGSFASPGPVNGTSYTANTVWGSGSAIGGGFVVYIGNANSVSVTNLNPATMYYVSIYTFYDDGFCYTPNVLNGTFVTPGALPLTDFNFNLVKTSQQQVNLHSFSEIKGNIVLEKSIDTYSWQHLLTTHVPDSKFLTYTDNSPETGITYYRCSLYDRNGTFLHAITKTIENKAEEHIFVYPNPAQSNFQLQVQSSSKNPLILQITDFMGKTVHEQQLPQNLSVHTIIPGLANGIYQIKVITDTRILRTVLCITQ